MNVAVFQVAYDSGFRGLRMGAGPLRLLHDGLADHLADPDRQVTVVPVETRPGFTAEVASAFELAGRVRDATGEAVAEGRFPLLLAGNCVVSIGALAALGQPDVYWFDAHGDLNTPETTGSGFLDGMALSILLGRCWSGMAAGIGVQPAPEDRVWLLGARDLDAAEADYLEGSGVRRVGPGELGRLGRGDGDRRAYLHIDLDSLDPSVGRANGFAAAGGFGVGEILDAVDRISGTASLIGAALTAYDPEADADGAVRRAAFRIARHVVERAEAGPDPLQQASP
jgi:arginase